MALVARATSLALKCGSASKPRPSPVQITPLGSDVNARQQREHDASCESARALALIRAEILSRYCIGEREREVEKQTEGGAFWRDTSHFSKRKKNPFPISFLALSQFGYGGWQRSQKWPRARALAIPFRSQTDMVVVFTFGGSVRSEHRSVPTRG